MMLQTAATILGHGLNQTMLQTPFSTFEATVASLAVPISETIPPLWCISLVFFIAALCGEIVGFGQAFMWNAGLRLLCSLYGIQYSLERSVAMWCGGELLLSIFMILRAPCSIHAEMVLAVGPALICTAKVGNMILNTVDSSTEQVLLGGMILMYSLFCIVQTTARRDQQPQDADAEDSPNSSMLSLGTDLPLGAFCFWAVTAGCFTGLIGGFTGMSGIQLSVFFSRTHLKDSELRSTLYVLVFLLNMESLYWLSAEKEVDWPTFASGYEAVWIAGLVGMLVGTVVGIVAARRISNTSSFHRMLMIFYILGGCLLIAQGNIRHSLYVFAGVSGILAVLIMIVQKIYIITAAVDDQKEAAEVPKRKISARGKVRDYKPAGP